MEVVVRTTAGEAELTIDADDRAEATLVDLAVAVRGRPAITVAIDGGSKPATTPLVVAGVRRGSEIELDPPPLADDAEAGIAPSVELVTIAGVGVGRRRRLGPGRHHIGPGLGDGELADGVVDEVRWRLIVAERPAARSQLVELDDRVIELRPPGAGHTRADRCPAYGPAGDDGKVVFNRPPRSIAAVADPPLPVPDATRRRDDARSLPVVAMIAPLPIAVTMALALGSWRYALFGLLSPVMVVANAFEDRRARRRAGRSASRTDRAAARAVAAEIADRHHAAVIRHRDRHPDLAALLSWMSSGHPRLWERRPDHDDWLAVPIGWGDERWRPVVERGRDAIDVQPVLDAHRWLRGVPVTIDLGVGTGLGVVGPGADARAVARAVVLAATALHGPADLSVVVCADPQVAPEWEWAKWLPHLRGEAAGLCTDPAAVPIPTLPSVERWERARIPPRVTLVVTDGAGWWHGHHAPLRALTARPDVRVVALVDDQRYVPATATAVVVVSGPGRATLQHLPSGTVITGVVVNRVEPDIALGAARRLARWEDPDRPANGTPATVAPVRLLTALGLPVASSDDIRRRWNDPTRRAATPLGAGIDGTVVADLVADGPHLLIAGTTGSGKSELLRTLVAGLAATLPPSELNVVLIDFKGGAAFDACGRLPHTVGMVTDLDEHLAGRMLRSLGAEITHRERRLRATGAASLDEVIARGDPTGMARLLIVVDEFAALAGRLPAFVSGLVDIAQRGRSLGVHLVLATQRPTGVVDHKIRANTNLRIALRVHDDADSIDVIGTRDAVALPRDRPGRAVARFGAGELVEFQTALASGPAPPDARHPVRVAPYVLARSLTVLERRLGDEHRPTDADGTGPSDLDRLVDAIVAAAGPVSPRRPCLDPLPRLVHVHEVPVHAEREGPGVPLALVDRPDEQRWSLRTWRPGTGGSLGLIGATGAGTTSALLTLALGLAATIAPDDVHLYAIDADAGRLLALAPLPHVGAVVTPADLVRVARLVRHLDAEIDRRRRPAAAAAAGAAGRAATQPAIVVLIDNVASLRQRLDGDRRWHESWSAIERTARDGPGVGITLIVTASHERGVPSGLAGHLAQRLVLRLADRSAYAAFGLRPGEVPDLGPGRALDPATGLEHQLLAPPADVAGAVAATADRWPPPAHPPRPIPPLPDRVTVAELAGHGRDDREGWLVPIGLDRRDGEIVTVPVRRGQVLAVYGSPGTGRTSALRTLLRALADHDPDVARYAISPEPDADDLAIRPGAPGEVAPWVDTLLADRRPRVVAIDDADLLGGPSLARLAAERDRDLAVVLAGTPERLRDPEHWARRLLRARSGLLLAPAAGDGDLLRVTVPASREPITVGRGEAVVDGVLIPVLVAETTVDRDGRSER